MPEGSIDVSIPSALPGHPNVLLGIESGLATITLNRPEKSNALDMATGLALADAINRACKDSSVRVLLLHGAGKAFCVGGDIDMLKSAAESLPKLLDSLLGPLNEALVNLASSGLPVVSALNGAIGGGGIGIALCADYVLAAKSLRLRCGYSAIGLTPDAGSSWFLTRRIGAIRAKQLFLLNRLLNAEECLAIGVVDAIYPDDELEARATELASQLCAGPRDVYARIKCLADGAFQRSLAEQLALEREYMVLSGSQNDAREGLAAFVDKRAPAFGS